MSKRSIKILLSAVLVAASALTVTAPANAKPGSGSDGGPLTHVRVATHFDLSAGQMPENIALLPDGTAAVTFAASRQVAQITRRGDTRVLATLPAPADGGVNTPALGFPWPPASPTAGTARCTCCTRPVQPT
ncbi:hypothetical protein NKH18_34765 [Streptomyces sp. M10(2022)]